MKTVLHLLRNDFHFLKPWLMLWVGVLCLPLILFSGFLTGLGWQPSYWAVLIFVLPFLYLLQVMLQLILIAKLIQKESPVVAQAYWSTRPISISKLILSKGVGVLLWIVLPSLGQAVLLRYLLQGNFSGITDVFAEMLFWVTALSLLGVVAASLGRDMNKSLLICVFLPVIYLIFRTLILGLCGVWFFRTAFMGHLLSLPVVSMLLAYAIILTGVWGFWCCYKRRRSKWWQVMAYSPLLIVVFLFEQSVPSMRPPENDVALPKNAELVVQKLMFEAQESSVWGRQNNQRGDSIETWRNAKSKSAKGLRGEIFWSGLPEDLLWISYAQSTTAPDGTWLSSLTKYPRIELMRHFDSLQLGTSGFPKVSVERIPEMRGLNITLFSSSTIDVDRLKFPVTFKTSIKTDFYTPKLLEIPFSLNQGFDILGGRIVVDAVDVMGDDLIIQLRYLDYNTADSYVNPFEVGGIAARDPVTGEVVFARRGSSSGSGFLTLVSMRDVELTLSGVGKHAHDLSALTFYFISLEYMGSDLREVAYSLEDDSMGERQ